MGSERAGKDVVSERARTPAANRIDHEPAYPVDTANLERSRKLPPPRHRQIPASKPE